MMTRSNVKIRAQEVKIKNQPNQQIRSLRHVYLISISRETNEVILISFHSYHLPRHPEIKNKKPKAQTAGERRRVGRPRWQILEVEWGEGGERQGDNEVWEWVREVRDGGEGYEWSTRLLVGWCGGEGGGRRQRGREIGERSC